MNFREGHDRATASNFLQSENCMSFSAVDFVATADARTHCDCFVVLVLTTSIRARCTWDCPFLASNSTLVCFPFVGLRKKIRNLVCVLAIPLEEECLLCHIMFAIEARKKNGPSLIEMRQWPLMATLMKCPMASGQFQCSGRLYNNYRYAIMLVPVVK